MTAFYYLFYLTSRKKYILYRLSVENLIIFRDESVVVSALEASEETVDAYDPLSCKTILPKVPGKRA